MIRTRFAPSPTGPLHLGHAYSAIIAHEVAQAQGGEFIIRIEDLDQSRSRAHWKDQIFDDMAWLGLTWKQPVMRQSERHVAYRSALSSLAQMGLLYPCICTRRDIANAVAAPQEGEPLAGPDGLIYPGTCRDRPLPQNPMENTTLRLDMAKALESLNVETLRYFETGPMGTAETIVEIDLSQLPKTVGDVVLARKDMGAAYHLAVVVDDAAQSITHAVRGEDLRDATQIHVLLQALLGPPTPKYLHHDLIRDNQGKRLAKRDDARSIQTYRDAGHSPANIRTMVGL